MTNVDRGLVELMELYLLIGSVDHYIFIAKLSRYGLFDSLEIP